MGKIHSFESCGMIDGPGIRFITFFQGCPLRCQYCHNPDTWKLSEGKEYTSDEVLAEILKYERFIKRGGVTISGGEPLMQKDFLLEILKKCKSKNIHTAVDTSGYVKNIDEYKDVIDNTDLFLLDIKSIDENIYEDLTGVKLEYTKKFLEYLKDINKKVWIRYVLVPGLTDNIEHIRALKEYLNTFTNIEKIEVLPFHKLGEYKWEELGYKYNLENTEAPNIELVKEVKDILEK